MHFNLSLSKKFVKKNLLNWLLIPKNTQRVESGFFSYFAFSFRANHADRCRTISETKHDSFKTVKGRNKSSPSIFYLASIQNWAYMFVQFFWFIEFYSLNNKWKLLFFLSLATGDWDELGEWKWKQNKVVFFATWNTTPRMKNYFLPSSQSHNFFFVFCFHWNESDLQQWGCEI